MAFTPTILTLQPDTPLTVKRLGTTLNYTHDDCVIKILIDGQLVDVAEIRQASTGVGQPVCKVFVPVK